MKLVFLVQSYQKSSGIDTSWNFYYFLKENSCKMIWWRLRTKIHIWSTWMWFKTNYLYVFSCMKTHNKASISYFTPPYVLQPRTKKTNHHSQTLIKYTWKTLQRKWKDCTINLHERNPRKCSKKHELDNRGLKVWQNQNRSYEAVEGDSGGYHVLSIQRGPTCSTSLHNPTAIEARQHIPSFPKMSWHFPSY